MLVDVEQGGGLDIIQEIPREVKSTQPVAEWAHVGHCYSSILPTVTAVGHDGFLEPLVSTMSEQNCLLSRMKQNNEPIHLN